MDEDLFILIIKFLITFQHEEKGSIYDGDGGFLKSFESSDDLKYVCGILKQGILQVHPHSTDNRDWTLRINYTRHGLTLTTELKQHGDNFIDLMDKAVSLLITVSENFHELYYLSYNSGVLIRNIDIPHLFPPKDLMDWGEIAAMDVFQGVTYWNSNQLDTEMQQIIEAAQHLPDTAVRIMIKEFMFIKWVQDFSSEFKVKKDLIIREKWYVEHFNLPPAIGYNELGDKLEANSGLKQHSNLSFYDPDGEIGYMKIYDENTFEIIEDKISEAIKLKLLETINTATKIKELRLIAPDRESTLQIIKKYKASGIDNVFYIDKDNNFWNPEKTEQFTKQFGNIDVLLKYLSSNKQE